MLKYNVIIIYDNNINGMIEKIIWYRNCGSNFKVVCCTFSKGCRNKAD